LSARQPDPGRGQQHAQAAADDDRRGQRLASTRQRDRARVRDPAGTARPTGASTSTWNSSTGATKEASPSTYSEMGILLDADRPVLAVEP
jgi:hypothetical protein